MNATRIAHLSDLHFSNSPSQNDLSAWGALLATLPGHRPHLVVVTGDLADQPKVDALKTARGHIEQLAAKLRIPFPATEEEGKGIIVLPGNHDVSFFGNIGWSLRSWRKVFGTHGLRQGFWIRQRNLALYCFNSCDRHTWRDSVVPFARGRVGKAQITEFLAWCAERQDDSIGAFSSALKIALLHHHPLPIAGVENESESGTQKYLAMDDGARLLQVLGQKGFRIVLHGHNHYPQITEIETTYLNKTKFPITVVAGGSASTPYGLNKIGHTFTIIDIEPTGVAEMRIYPRSGVDWEPPLTHKTSFWDQQRSAIIREYAEAAHMVFDEVSKQVTVHSNGVADIHLSFQGGRVTTPDRVVGDLKVRLTRTLAGNSLLEQPTVNATFHVDGEDVKKARWNDDTRDAEVRAASRVIEGAVIFPEDLQESSPLASIDIQYSASNVFATTKEQHQLQYGYHEDKRFAKGRREWISVPLDVATKKVVLKVTFLPGTTRILRATHEIAAAVGASLEPEIHVGRDSDGDAAIDSSTPWTVTIEGQKVVLAEERRKNHNIRTADHEGSKSIELTVDQPLPGVRYYLSWVLPSINRIPAATIPENRDKLRIAESTKEHLRMHAASALTVPLQRQLVGPFLATIRDLIKPKGSAEFMEVGMAVYDHGENALKFVSGEFSQPEAAARERYKVGVGVVGHAFKTKQPLLWVLRDLEENSRDNRELYRKPSGYDKPHEVILAVPLLYPLESEQSGEERAISQNGSELEIWRYVVAVAVLRSCDPATALLSLWGDNGQDSALPLFVEYTMRAFSESLPELKSASSV